MKAGLGAAANGPRRGAGQQPVGMAAAAPDAHARQGSGAVARRWPWRCGAGVAVGGADSSALLHADALGGLAKERHGVGLELEGG